MHRLIVVGSPRANGRSAHLADEIFNACIEDCPEDGVSIVSVASTDVRPCTGCDACRAVQADPLFSFDDGDPLASCAAAGESDAAFHACVIGDDMNEVRKHLDAADELIVVAPVYFAGAPAQMKALLDRLQPYYWSNMRRRASEGGASGEARPCTLHVVGEGGDPHGFEPLISTVRSAVAVAGFRLEAVLDWVGKIDADGEIVADAEEYPIPPIGGFAAVEVVEEAEDAAADAAGAAAAAADEGASPMKEGHDDTFAAAGGCRAEGRRPQLSLGSDESAPTKETRDTVRSGGSRRQTRRSSERRSGGPRSNGSRSGGSRSKGGKRRG